MRDSQTKHPKMMYELFICCFCGFFDVKKKKKEEKRLGQYRGHIFLSLTRMSLIVNMIFLNFL